MKENKGNNSTNNENLLVIDKKAVENYFFISVLCLSIVVFCVIFIKGAMNISSNQPNGVDSSLLSSYLDENLNVLYPIPGGTWELAQIDDAEISEIIKESSGDDNIFDITMDTLASEVLSSACFNEQGDIGYRQFMSFTFKPDGDYEKGKFLEYCKESFKNDITGNGEVDYKDYTFISADEDNNGGVLLKGILTQDITTEEDGKSVTEESVSYYTQYTKSIGTNIMTVTFGSVFEDSTIDEYLKHFVINTINQNSLKQ